VSKRVSNKKGKHAGARCKGVRLGYHRRTALSSMQKLRNQLEGTVATDDEHQEKLTQGLANVKERVQQLMPKSLLRRHQSR
jgi:hypothetical protein